MRSQKERAIERFVSGRMSPSEQQEFQKLAASDTSIQRQVRAEQAIATAIEHDRATLPAVATEPGQHLMHAFATATPAGTAAAVAGSLWMKIAGGCAGALLLAGTVLMVVHNNGPQSGGTDVANTRTESTPTIGDQPAVAPGTTQSAEMAAGELRQTASAYTFATDVVRQVALSTTPSLRRIPSRPAVASVAPSATAQPARSGDAAGHEVRANTPTHSGGTGSLERQEPTVFEDDTVRLSNGQHRHR